MEVSTLTQNRTQYPLCSPMHVHVELAGHNGHAPEVLGKTEQGEGWLGEVLA